MFFKEAQFFSTDEVVSYLKKAGFKEYAFYQTLYKPLKDIKRIEHVENGYGKGSFIVIKARKE